MNRRETSQSFVALTNLGAALLALALILIAVFKGVRWLNENIVVYIDIASGFVLLVGVPLGLVLAIFRGSRWLGATLLLCVARLTGFVLWADCIAIAYVLAGFFWMIVGFLVAGFGIIPVAFIAGLVRGEWGTVVGITINAVIVGVLWWIGAALLTNALPEEDELPQTEEDSLSQQKQIEELLAKLDDTAGYAKD